MVGTPVIGAWTAQIAFWVLLILAVVHGALGKFGVGAVASLWLAGCLMIPRLSWWTGPLVTPFVAALDIMLVFVVFKGDVRIT